jgi:hypothetical protein
MEGGIIGIVVKLQELGVVEKIHIVQVMVFLAKAGMAMEKTESTMIGYPARIDQLQHLN